jgi:hypothetical protein
LLGDGFGLELPVRPLTPNAASGGNSAYSGVNLLTPPGTEPSALSLLWARASVQCVIGLVPRFGL